MNKFKLVVLAASAMFATTFTLSACSGDDGKNGKDGASCTINGDELTCGDKIVVLFSILNYSIR
ncbi:MAG: hypothetical protein FWF67_00620 [Fibromonadales bacterium]|nr:hypothetical protein [Fibromonadales bacterium]